MNDFDYTIPFSQLDDQQMLVVCTKVTHGRCVVFGLVIAIDLCKGVCWFVKRLIVHLIHLNVVRPIARKPVVLLALRTVELINK